LPVRDERIEVQLGHIDVINRDPEIMSGTPIFAGTRVPVRSLFDWLSGGHSLREFLDNFPTVSEEKARVVLRRACEVLNLPSWPTSRREPLLVQIA
jgi:uncharacterized protein (DUF433 family)